MKIRHTYSLRLSNKTLVTSFLRTRLLSSIWWNRWKPTYNLVPTEKLAKKLLHIFCHFRKRSQVFQPRHHSGKLSIPTSKETTIVAACTSSTTRVAFTVARCNGCHVKSTPKVNPVIFTKLPACTYSKVCPGSIPSPRTPLTVLKFPAKETCVAESWLTK